MRAFTKRLVVPCAVLWMVVGCAEKQSAGKGQGNGGVAGGTAAAGGSGGGIGGTFGNTTGGSGGPVLMTLPDGGMLPVDPTNQAFFQDDTGLSGLDPGTIDELKKGGGACTAPVMYPYNGTVFPRGLPAPMVMWSGGADAAYVHLRYANQSNVDYQFAAGASNPGMLTIPQAAWEKIANRSTRAQLLVTLNVKTAGAVSSCETAWQVAEGTLTGAVYYNTYNAPGAMFPNQGAVMRLTLGQAMSEVYLQDPSPKNTIKGTGPCISCHSLSFDGSMLVASRHDYGGNDPFTKVFKFEVSSYPVSPNLQPAALSPIHRANFGALYPDGKSMLIMGNPQCTNGAETFPRAPNNFMMVEGPTVAKLVDTATGAAIPAPGLMDQHYMWMPQFSPDGLHVVFNHAKPGAGGTDRRELAMMDYNPTTREFSNLQVLVSNQGPAPNAAYAPAPTLAGTITDACTPALTGGEQTATIQGGTCSGPCYPGWPFFTPDGRGVIYLLTNEPDFASAFPGRTTPTLAELWYVDVATKQTVRLDKANSVPGGGDALSNYYPTVMPVAIGGYFWLFWTSKRPYGNQVYPNLPQSDTFAISTGFAEMDAKNKRIWVSAIRPVVTDGEFSGMTLEDPSHPGFFLTGQSESGNVRAFTTLNPCRPAGDTCESGLDCCTGFCFIPEDKLGTNEFDVKPVGHCSEQKPPCARTNERCFSDSECCPPVGNEPKNTCIGGFCSYIIVPE